jgi:hypothetical protein
MHLELELWTTYVRENLNICMYDIAFDNDDEWPVESTLKTSKFSPLYCWRYSLYRLDRSKTAFSFPVKSESCYYYKRWNGNSTYLGLWHLAS